MMKNVCFRRFLIVLALATPAWAGIIEDVRTALAQNNFSAADSYLNSYRARNGVTPEYIEAYSWMGRAALNAQDYGRAAAYAKQARGQRSQAMAVLQTALRTYGTTSIRQRLQKNLNLLSFEGRPAPALKADQFLGSKPP